MAEVRGNLHLGKSGLHQGTVPGNARAGQPDGQRHREQTARRTNGSPMDHASG
jgi:hypothetical protein